MTPEELKLSILQSAFQGKLTEQSSDEGMGEELLNQFKLEKRRLIKEKAIKSEKPLPEITDEMTPFDIPDTWTWAYIGDLFLHNTGKAQNSSGSTIGTVRKFITTSNLYWNEFDFTKVKEMPFTEKELERCTVKKGDLLVCEGGDCGRSAIWTYDEEVCIQNHVHRLRPYLDVDIHYFYHLFYLYKFTGRLRGRGVAIQGLSNEAIHRVICPLPPLEEQHRIVLKIEELLPYVDRYASSYEKLEQFNAKFPEEMKKSILQYAIQGKLVEQRPEEGTAEELYQQIQEEKQRLIKECKIKKEKLLNDISDEEILFDIPDTWKWVRLGHIITFQGGYAFKSTSYIESSKNQVIRLGNVKNNHLLLHEKEVFVDDDVALAADDYKLRENDILVTMTGTRRKKDYFFTLIVDKNDLAERNLYLNQRVGCFRVLPGIDVNYLLTALQNEAIRNVIFLKETGTANQGNLGSEDMKEFVYIPLPPYEEQRRIVEKLKCILPYCDQMQYIVK